MLTVLATPAASAGSEALEAAAESDDLGVHVACEPVRRGGQRLAEVLHGLGVVQDEALGVLLALQAGDEARPRAVRFRNRDL